MDSLIKNITQNLIDFVLKISDKIFPQKIYELEKKILNIEIVLYVFFGVLTTIVNIGIFSLLTYTFGIEENLSNVAAIIVAVLFAYVTNKSLVFNSKATTLRDKITEFFKFMLGRLFTMGVEFVGFFLMFNKMEMPKFLSKVIITVLVIILNFFISKFFAFKTK